MYIVNVCVIHEVYILVLVYIYISHFRVLSASGIVPSSKKTYSVSFSALHVYIDFLNALFFFVCISIFKRAIFVIIIRCLNNAVAK